MSEKEGAGCKSPTGKEGEGGRERDGMKRSKRKREENWLKRDIGERREERERGRGLAGRKLDEK